MNNYQDPATKVTSPDAALKLLKEGNARFIANDLIAPNYPDMRAKTAKQQSPFASILTCADSRTAPEIFFDQGIGNLFVVRNAGNVADREAVGSFQFAANVLGSQIIVVVGHTECGAVFNAHDGTQVGELTALQGILDDLAEVVGKSASKDESLRVNVLAQVENIKKSPGINVPVYGVIYDLATGVCEWL